MIAPRDVTAVIPTRGDVEMEPILESLIFPNVLIWTGVPDLHVFNRYDGISKAETAIVYTQDDDVIVPEETQFDLLAAYTPGYLVANYGHGDDPDGYDDMALVHAGAIFDRELPIAALARYLDHFALDEGFFHEADMITGTLTPHLHVHFPHEIRMEIATAPNRMCNQPWQRDLKYEVTERARAIRDGRA